MMNGIAGKSPAFSFAALLGMAAASAFFALVPGMALAADVTDANISAHTTDYTTLGSELGPYSYIQEGPSGLNITEGGVIAPLDVPHPGGNPLRNGNTIELRDSTLLTVIGGIKLGNSQPLEIVTGNVVNIYNDIGSSTAGYLVTAPAGSVYGGLSTHVEVSENEVYIHGGRIFDEVFGGRSIRGAVNGNIVAISGSGTVVDSDVRGGMTVSGSGAKGNSVNITGGTAGDVAGGYIANRPSTCGDLLTNFSTDGVDCTANPNPAAEENSVTIKGTGIEVGSVSGGYIEGAGTATGNFVTIQGPGIETGRLTGVFFEGEGIAGYVDDAAYTSSDKTLGNRVVVTGAVDVSSGIFGAEFGEQTSSTALATAIGNSVVVTGAHVEGDIAGANVGNRPLGSVKLQYNTAEVSGVVFDNYAVDGLFAGAEALAPASGEISNNTLVLKDGTKVAYAFGGLARGSAANASVRITENTLRFEGATVTQNAAAGYTDNGSKINVRGNHVEFASGINEITNLRVFGDLKITGGTKNTITNVYSILDGVAISGGTNNVFENGLEAQGPTQWNPAVPGPVTGGITISGGTTTVKTGITVNPATSIKVGGTGRLILDDDSSAFDIDGNVEIGNGGELSLADNSASPNSRTFTQSSGNLAVKSGGILNLDEHELVAATGGTATFANNATIVTNGDSLNHGVLDLNSATSWGFDAIGSRVNVLHVGSRLDSGDVIIDASSAPTINGAGSSFYSPNYSLTVGANGVEVDEYTGYAGGFSNLAYGPIPNLVRVGRLLDAIDYDSAIDPAAFDIISRVVLAYGQLLGFSAADADKAARQLIGEAVLNVQLAATNIALKTQGVVFGRLDKIRSGNSLTPPSAGSGSELNRVWAGGFGTWARQKNANGVYGYDYDAAGFSLGYDRAFSGLEGLVLGVAVSFSYGKLDTNRGLSDVDIDTAGIGVYGSYTFQNGAFLDGSFAYARSSNKYKADLVTGGHKKGSFDVDTWQLALRGGMNFEAGNFVITPSLGVRYLWYRQEGFTEKVINSYFPRNFYEKVSDRLVEIPLELKIKTTLGSGDFKVTPELRLGWTYAAKRPDNAQSVGFVGYSGTVPIYGVKQPRSTFQTGLGVNIETGGPVDVFVNYDANFAKRFYEHRGSVGIGFQF